MPAGRGQPSQWSGDGSGDGSGAAAEEDEAMPELVDEPDEDEADMPMVGNGRPWHMVA